jgi:hypothetical protein
MSGVLGYVLGYEDGRSSAESSRRTREVVDAVFYGQRLVQVDQSYIDNLRHAADHNYNKGTEYQNDAVYWKGKAEQFHGEALYWRGRALPAEADAIALRAENESLQAQLAERAATLAQAQKACAAERAVHQTTHEEKCSLDRFRLLATWLANAHIAGRSGRPEFAELLDMVKNAAEAIQRGERFRGYLDTPENEARLDRVVAALDPP